MGRKSTKENKNKFQLVREDLDISRAAVEDANIGISESRLEKMENGQTAMQPEDAMALSTLYKDPHLRNYYCSNMCAIGREYVPKVESMHDLPQITLSVLSSLNTLNRDRDAIIDAVADGEISDDERQCFEEFKDHLIQMSEAVTALKLWAEKTLI